MPNLQDATASPAPKQKAVSTPSPAKSLRHATAAPLSPVPPNAPIPIHPPAELSTTLSNTAADSAPAVPPAAAAPSSDTSVPLPALSGEPQTIPPVSTAAGADLLKADVSNSAAPATAEG